MKPLTIRYLIPLTGLFAFAGFLSNLSAEDSPDKQSTESPKCPLNGPSDALKCSLSRNPEVLHARMRFQESQATKDIADNVPNPSLAGQYMFSSGEAELEYRHVIELGDRRELRTREADAEIRLRALELEMARQDTILSTVMALYQLEHIQEELKYLNETIQAFNAAIYRLYRLPSRDANQNTSLFTYLMARDSLRQQKLEAQDRWNQIRRNLEVKLGRSLDDQDLSRIAAGHPQKWPAISEDFGKSLEQAHASQEVSRATYSHRLESSRIWPDITIGPRISLQKSQSGGFYSRERTSTELGLSFSVTLPLYNQYTGEQDRARAREHSSEIQKERTDRGIQSEYRYIVRSYRQHVSGLKTSPTMRILEGRRYAVLGYLRRGLLSPALLVEFHRTYGEHVHQYHAAQLRALSMLWRSYALTGRILDEEIIESIK